MAFFICFIFSLYVTNQSPLWSPHLEASTYMNQVHGHEEVAIQPVGHGDQASTTWPGGRSSSSGASVQAGESGTPSKDAKYWEAYDVAVQQISKWEWLKLLAYKDVKQCSIGYGFYWSLIPSDGICRWTMTQAESDRRLAELVHTKLKQVLSDFPGLSSEKQGTLVSFSHNCPAGYRDIVRYGLSRHSLWCRTAGGKVLTGLVKRRIEEAKILFK